jgi:16S rRNA (guanine966-N2)-methyltransferase
MRIISGKFKGRRFHPPADNWPTRPTTDYAKEGLFNILTNEFDFEELKVLDLFGGTGSHSYEFISRGCEDVTYVDKHPPAIDFVKKTTIQLKIEDNMRIIPGDVFKFIERAYEQYDYIFAGPPYGIPGLDTLPDKVFGKKILRGDGWFVLEHNPNHKFEHHPHFFQARHYGKTIFSIFKNEVKNESENDKKEENKSDLLLG